MITSSLNVECCKVFTESAWRILGEQIMRYLIGNELIASLRTIANEAAQHHVHSSPWFLIQQMRIVELLFTNIVKKVKYSHRPARCSVAAELMPLQSLSSFPAVISFLQAAVMFSAAQHHHSGQYNVTT